MAKTPSLNSVIISGNIVEDAVVKHVGQNNNAVTTIRIANNQSYLDKDNNWQDRATFIDVEIWGIKAEKGEKYYKKGIPVIVQGNLKENHWVDKNGKKFKKILISADKIHMLDYPKKKE